MSHFSINVGFSVASRLFLTRFLVILGLFAMPWPVLAQGKAASTACIPSDLSALIVPEGRTVHVNEVKEFGREGRAPDKTSSPGLASSSFNAGDKEEAYEVFLKEARQGNPAAMVNLAVSSLAGWGTQPNAGGALYWLRAAADRGYARAFYNLGILYFKGCGVRQDAAEAFHFFDLGARSGNTAAQVNLGYFYDHGLGVAQDHGAAAFWYRQAAESGEAQAQYNLADLYLHGEGVPEDESMAFAWFQKAALQGHTSAQITTGSMLAAGRGTSKDLAAAYLWIFAATLQGDDRGAPELRVLERQLTGEEIEQAKVRVLSLLRAQVPSGQVALSH
jgi:uncharacterized protein